MKQRTIYERCGICEEEKKDGIHLYTLFICCECEHNIIHTEPREEKYNYYLRKLKNISKPKLYSQFKKSLHAKAFFYLYYRKA